MFIGLGLFLWGIVCFMAGVDWWFGLGLLVVGVLLIVAGATETASDKAKRHPPWWYW